MYFTAGKGYATRRLVHDCKIFQADEKSRHELALSAQTIQQAVNNLFDEQRLLQILDSKAAALREFEPRNWAPADAETVLLLNEVQAIPQYTPSQPLIAQQTALSCAAQAPPAPSHKEITRRQKPLSLAE